MATNASPGGAVALLSLAAPRPDRLPAPLQSEVGGEVVGLLAASALPIAVARRLVRLGRDVQPVHLGVDPASGRMILPVAPINTASLADFGRALGVTRLGVGELAPDGRDVLRLDLLDCERRRAVATTEIPLTGRALKPLYAGALRFFARDAGLLPHASDEEIAATDATEEVLLAYWRALHLEQVVDDEGRPAELQGVIQLLTNALIEDPDHVDAAYELARVAARILRPNELDWILAQKESLLELAAKTRPEAGEVVLALTVALALVVETGLLVPLLQRPMVARLEVRRRVALAQALHLAGRLDEALATAREALAAEPGRADSAALFARLLRVKGGGGSAEEQALWNQVLAAAPDLPEALNARFAWLAEHDPPAALQLLPKVLREGGPLALELLPALIDLVTKLPESIPRIAAGLERRSIDEHAPPLLVAGFGRLLHALGLHARAELYFLVALDRGLPLTEAVRVRALLARPRDFDFTTQVGRVADLVETGAATAVSELEELRAAAPDFWPVDLLAARLAEARGEVEAARESCTALLQRSGGAAEVRSALARLGKN